LEPSIKIISAYINQRSNPNDIQSVPKIKIKDNYSKVFRCDFCDKRLSGFIAYESHLKSKGHKYQLNHKNNLKKLKIYQLFGIISKHENNMKNNRRNTFKTLISIIFNTKFVVYFNDI
jgi:hypothetical protein